MPGERLTLRREVDAKVRSAALLSHERALRDEPSEQVRCRAEPLEAGSVANEPTVFPDPLSKLSCHGLRR